MTITEGRVTANDRRVRVPRDRVRPARPVPPRLPGSAGRGALCPRARRAGYRAVAPYMRGYAPTPSPRTGASPRALGEDAYALHDALGGEARGRLRARLGRRRGVHRRDPRRRRRRVVTAAVPPAGAVPRRVPPGRPAADPLVHVLLPAPPGRHGRRRRTTSRSSTGSGRTGRPAPTPPRTSRLKARCRPRPPGGRARLLPGHLAAQAPTRPRGVQASVSARRSRRSTSTAAPTAA